MLEVDAAIIGAGPAGAVTALNLAPFRSVLLVDRRAVPGPRIGECLPGAARRLLADMDLLKDFLADGHAPLFAYRSAWGDGEPVERDTLRDPDGHGWQLDRARFERRLRAVAAARGARLIAPARPTRVERNGQGWQLSIDHGGEPMTVRAKLLVDAGGRSSRLLARHGGVRHVQDRLVCRWVRYGQAGMPAGLTHIEAEPDGWWYATALPGGGAMLAFHTDGDLPAARTARSNSVVLARAKALPMLGGLFGSGTWTRPTADFCAAHGARLECPVGRDWIAVGDAALAFDPLASQGLFNALHTGLAGAEAAHRHLAGDSGALPSYAEELRQVSEVYDAHRAAWYGIERRWRDRPFWQRREQAAR